MEAASPRARLDAGGVGLALILGAVLGTAWDRFHVAAGTLSYPRARWGQPWWVPVEFALAFAAAMGSVATLGRPAPDTSSPRRAILDTVWFTAVYGLTAVLWKQPYVCALALASLAALRWRAFATLDTRNLAAAIGLVVIGPAVEAALSSAGLFAYAPEHLIARVPVWLPLLYLHAVPLAVHATEATIAIRSGREGHLRIAARS